MQQRPTPMVQRGRGVAELFPADQDLLPAPERLEWEMAKADGRHSTELPPGFYGCTVARVSWGERVVGDGRVNQNF